LLVQPSLRHHDLGQDFLGNKGGDANFGLAPGQSASFTFNLTGSHLNDLSSLSFANELSSGGQFFSALVPGYPAQGDEAGMIPPKTRFEDLPADWRCPQCWVNKQTFSPLGGR